MTPARQNRKAAMPGRASGRIRTTASNVARVLMAVLLVLSSLHAVAQDRPATTAVTEGERPGNAIGAAPVAGDTVILLDHKGNLITLPANATVEAFLDSLRQQEQRAGTDVVPYYIASIALNGDFDTTRSVAELEAVIDLLVDPRESRIPVPLRLDEATLIDHQYSGDGTLRFLPTERGSGMSCWLLQSPLAPTGGVVRSARHQLRLKLAVPVRLVGGTRRLQLALPGSAQSSLRLLTPDRITVSGTDLTDTEVTPLETGGTEVLVRGPGSRVDLSWQVVVAQPSVTTSLQVRTLMSADVAADGVLLDTVQTVTATRGTFDHLVVTVPENLTVLKVEVQTPGGDGVQPVETGREVRILLGGRTAGPVTLKWLLSAATDPQTAAFSLSGLRVAEAARQEDLLGMSVDEGLRVDRDPAQLQQMQPIRVSSFRRLVEPLLPPDTGTLYAWRMPSENWQATFRIERTTASFRAYPSYSVELKETSAELAAQFDIQVFRGSLDRITLKWPHLREDGWQQIEVTGRLLSGSEIVTGGSSVPAPAETASARALSSTSAGSTPVGTGPRPVVMPEVPLPAAADAAADAAVVVSVDVIIPEADPGSLQLSFTRSADRRQRVTIDRRQRLRLELRCRRPVPSGDEPFLLTLPTVEVEPTSLAAVTFRNAASVESQIEPATGTSARLLPRTDRAGRLIETPASGSTATTSIAEQDLRTPPNQWPRTWETDSSGIAFLTSIAANPQQVNAESRATVTVGSDDFRVEQTLEFAVAYQRADHVRVVVPASVLGGSQTRFYWQMPGGSGVGSPQRREIVPTGAGLVNEDGSAQLRLPLPDVMWGRFDIVCQYQVPIETGMESPLEHPASVPLITPVDATTRTTQVELIIAGDLDVRRRDNLWRQELTAGRPTLWVTDGAQPRVDVLLAAGRDHMTENFTVRRAALRTHLQNGFARTQAAYLIDGRVSYLTIQLPDSVDLSTLRLWWDGEPAADWRSVQTGEIRLDVTSGSTLSQHVLVVNYVDAMPDFDGWTVNFRDLSSPRFSSDVWLSDTLWEVIIPADQHLLVYPDNYTPRFSWRRNTLMWTRQDSVPELTPQSWLLDADVEISPAARTAVEELPVGVESITAGGNAYRFTAFGHQESMSLQTLSLPVIVLVGVGSALIVFIVLDRIRATRHVLTFLVLAFVMALAGLWHFEAVQLLLQPALAGFLAAAVVAVVDARRHREPQPLITFAPQGEVVLEPSHGSREELLV